MNNNYILSVIVTSYNYEKYIFDTLNSLANQTYSNFNVIIFDDGSTDNSINIIKKFCNRYNNFILLTHENNINMGLCETTKRALSYVNTEFVAFCESDDFWDVNHVKNLIEFIDNNPNANLIFNNIKVLNYSTNNQYEPYVESSKKFLAKNNGKNIFKFLNSNYMPTFSASCIKTELIKKCNFNSYYNQYLDFWIWRQLCIYNNIYYADDVITFWRKHNESYDMKENILDINDFLINSNKLLLSLDISYIQKINIFIKNIFMNCLKKIKNYVIL